jgi:uncharacterized membrane protein
MQDIFAPGFGGDPTILPGARHFRVPEFEMGYHEGMLKRPRPAGVPRIPFAEFADNKARHSSIKRSPTWLYCWLAAYAVCLILLLTRLSLWLDEILDLMGARIQSFPELISYVRSNAGAVPLGYLAQAAAIRAFGLSAFSGRLPSALASLAGCAGVYFLARRTAVRRPLLAAVAFAICPIQFRYALEARDYALALALSIYATLLFSFLRERPRSIGLQILYGICVLAGVYTQPFSLFVPIAHLAWLTLAAEGKEKRRLFVFVSLIIVSSGLLFLPWYVYASATWKEDIAANHLHGNITPRSLLLILHELAGMGYVGTGIVVIAAFLAAASRQVSRSDALFWLLYALVPILCVLLVDGVYGYFLAIRQMIFVVAPLSVIVALAVERGGRLGLVLGLAFAVAAVWNDVGLFNRPREDWRLAATILKTEVAQGACVLVYPAKSLRFYTFFLPELSQYECSNGGFERKDRIALALDPYGLRQEHFAVEQQVAKSGFFKVRELNAMGPRIEIFQRNRN